MGVFFFLFFFVMQLNKYQKYKIITVLDNLPFKNSSMPSSTLLTAWLITLNCPQADVIFTCFFFLFGCCRCSAGCGRTGALCVIDYTWNLLKNQVR